MNTNEGGKEYIHSIVEPGESLGEFTLFDDGLFAATAVADEDCILIRLHKPTFLQLIKENTTIHFAITQMLSKRLRFKFTVLESFAAHCPQNMIATLLKLLKSEKKNFCGDCDQSN